MSRSPSLSELQYELIMNDIDAFCSVINLYSNVRTKNPAQVRNALKKIPPVLVYIYNTTININNETINDVCENWVKIDNTKKISMIKLAITTQKQFIRNTQKDTTATFVNELIINWVSSHNEMLQKALNGLNSRSQSKRASLM